MSTLLNNQTIFQKKSQRCKSNSSPFMMIALVLVVISVIATVVTGTPRIAIPGPLLLIIAWRMGRNRTEDVMFFVHKNEKNDIYYAYMDEDKKRQGDLPIDEYTYWYVPGNSTKEGTKYTLVIMIRNNVETIYLKEEIAQRTPPQGWTLSKSKIENQKGVFLVPGLRDLAAMIDNASVSEEEPVQSM